MQIKSTGKEILCRCALWLLPFTLFTSGCQMNTVRLSAENTLNMKTVMIAAVESPPLEIIPDLLETRQPVIRSLETMAISIYSTPSLYRYPGGVLIYGQTVSDDSVEKLASDDPLLTRGDNPYSYESKINSPWHPARALAFHAAESLSKQGIKVVLNGLLRHLPLNAGQRQTHLSHWYNAIAQWYEENTSPVNYAKLLSTPVDAVIEVGISDFRIFEGQVSLQVLMKVIEPKSGRVLAKTGISDYTSRTSADSLLLPDGAAFKTLISEMGAKLIENDFKNIGICQSASKCSHTNRSEDMRNTINTVY
jgi:hypothetical protein